MRTFTTLRPHANIELLKTLVQVSGFEKGSECMKCAARNIGCATDEWDDSMGFLAESTRRQLTPSALYSEGFYFLSVMKFQQPHGLRLLAVEIPEN